MERYRERCAGLDVHKVTVTACVRLGQPDGSATSQTRTFGTTTKGLQQLAAWLDGLEVTLVGMEATGVYWKPVFYALEAHMTCWLLNAQHIKNVPGRKTDVADAAWIAQLVEHGLVRPSFVPPASVRELRDLTRRRKSLVEERTREAQRLHKVLEDSGVKLTSVASSVLGVSARHIVAALVAGEHDSLALAEMARGRLRAKLPELREALTGAFTQHHAFLAGQILDHLAYLDDAIIALSKEIAHRLSAEPEAEACTLLATIPGVGERTAEVILAEIGLDMSCFASPHHLASWAGLCPGNNESAGKHFSGRTRHGSPALRTALTQAAKAAARSQDTYLQAQYHRLKARRGAGKATIAVAHSILIAIYHILKDHVPYRDPGPDYFHQRHRDRRRDHLVQLLTQMGFEVSLSPNTPALSAIHT